MGNGVSITGLLYLHLIFCPQAPHLVGSPDDGASYFTEKLEEIGRKCPSHAPTTCMYTHIPCLAFTDMLWINSLCTY